MSRTKAPSTASEVAFAKYEAIFDLETKREALQAELDAVSEQIDAVNSGTAVMQSKRTKSSKGTRTRGSNGAMVPFLLKTISDDKSNPTGLGTIASALTALKEPITTSAEPKVVINQALTNNKNLIKRVSRGQYALTAAGVKAREANKKGKVDTKAEESGETDTKATAGGSKKKSKTKRTVKTTPAKVKDAAGAGAGGEGVQNAPDPADQTA